MIQINCTYVKSDAKILAKIQIWLSYRRQLDKPHLNLTRYTAVAERYNAHV